MANEVTGTSVGVYKMPRKRQETRHAANYPDVNLKIRAILMSCNHSPDVLPAENEVGGTGACLETLPEPRSSEPPGSLQSPEVHYVLMP